MALISLAERERDAGSFQETKGRREMERSMVKKEGTMKRREESEVVRERREINMFCPHPRELARKGWGRSETERDVLKEGAIGGK